MPTITKYICSLCEGPKDRRAQYCSTCRMKWFPPRKGTGVPRRIGRHGYVTIQVNNKAVYEHRFVMETFLGRALQTNEHVHHINGIRTDNRLENLECIESSQHQRHHMTSARAKEMSVKGHIARWGWEVQHS